MKWNFLSMTRFFKCILDSSAEIKIKSIKNLQIHNDDKTDNNQIQM